MAVPAKIWVATPNKTDHRLPGFTTKVIFNYQWPDALSVNNTYEVFNEIQNTFTKNYKGTNLLKSGYFQNIDDGRTLRISMYFLFELDESSINIVQQLHDVTNSVTYDFDFQTTGPVSADAGLTLVKYECYLSYFKDGNGDSIVNGIGSMNYASKAAGSSTYMINMYDSNTLTYGDTPDYEIRIKNNSSTKIYPVSLVVEEIS